MTRLALVGGDDRLRDELVAVLRALPSLELLPGRSGDGAELLLVAGDDALSAQDRCRAHATGAPCIMVVDDQVDGDVAREAMAAGARAIVARPLQAFALGRAADAASSFVPAGPSIDLRRGRVVALTAGEGGVGVSTLAVGLAELLDEPVALLDLDPAGGVLHERMGLAEVVGSAGLAGEDSGRRAFQRLAVPVATGSLVGAPSWPELAWMVRDGVTGELVEAAAGACASVLVDAGRGVGPALEALQAADLVLLVVRPGAAGTAAALRQRQYLLRIGVGKERIVVCRNCCSRRDVVLGRLAAGSLGPAGTVPYDEDLADGRLSKGMRRRLSQLVSTAESVLP